VRCQVVTVVMTCDFFDFLARRWARGRRRQQAMPMPLSLRLLPFFGLISQTSKTRRHYLHILPDSLLTLTSPIALPRTATHRRTALDPQATTSTTASSSSPPSPAPTSKNGRGRGVCQGMECPAGGLRQDPGPRSDAARYVCGGGVFELLASPSILYSSPLPLIPCCHPAPQVPSSATRTRAWPKPWQIFRPASPLPRKPSKSKVWAL
jgi:hypothetical protein